jgi:hypothetical protein
MQKTRIGGQWSAVGRRTTHLERLKYDRPPHQRSSLGWSLTGRWCRSRPCSGRQGPALRARIEPHQDGGQLQDAANSKLPVIAVSEAKPSAEAAVVRDGDNRSQFEDEQRLEI